MSINEIAKKLLNLRETRMTGFIMAGVLREELGFDGYGEALRRRWIEADMEQSGMVTISNNLGTVAEIRALAAEAQVNECKCVCGGKECKCTCKDGGECSCKPIKEDAHFLASSHAYRKMPVNEFATLGLGRTGDAPDMPVPGLGAQSGTPHTQHATPPPAQPAATPRPQAVGIGQDVAVVEAGKQYVGKVSKTLPDGKYEISFAGEQPPVRRSYDKAEVTTSAPAQ